MELGFITSYDEDKIRFAGEQGCNGLEVFCYKDTPMDVEKLSDDEIKRKVDFMAENGLRFSVLSCEIIHLDGDEAKRRENNAYFKTVIRKAHKFGTNRVTTNAFGNPDLSPAENLPLFKKVFTEYAKVAEDEGVQLTVENCPHWLGYPKRIGNIAFSPEMWDRIFDAVPSKAFGLQFDPSHLLWQGMNYAKLIRKYGERILAFHAKDTEILQDQLDMYGIIGKQIDAASIWESGWWRYRIPGWGQIDWKEVFKALLDIGYNGPIMIEHEDPVYSFFDPELTKEGLKLGLRFLNSFMLR